MISSDDDGEWEEKDEDEDEDDITDGIDKDEKKDKGDAIGITEEIESLVLFSSTVSFEDSNKDS